MDDSQELEQSSGPPERQYPAHPPPVQRHNTPTIVLVTACILHRRPVLAATDAQRALVSAWHAATAWVAGTYVIMPDHVHVFCAPGSVAPPMVKTWAKYWKRLVDQACPRLTGLWQMDVWDTQMRNVEHYLRKLEYVRQNPVRAGLVAAAEEWPYRGTVHPLHWISDGGDRHGG